MNHRHLPLLLSFASHLTGCSFTASVVPDTPDVSRVTVTTDSGDVEVRVADVSEPVVRYRRGTFSADSTPSVHLSDDGTTLVVDDGCSEVDAAVCHVDFEITLPDRPFHVHLASDSGELKVVGLRGSVSATTDSSDLQVKDATLSEIAMTSDSGDLRLRGTHSDAVSLTSNSGAIDAD